MPENMSVLYLVLLAATGGVCGYQIIRSLRDPTERLGLPLIFCLAFGYFYVFQAYYAVTTLGHHLQPWVFELGQTTALLALLTFLFGWRQGRRSPVSGVSSFAPVSDSAVYACGLIGMAVGAIGSFSYAYNGEVKLSETSAYLYLAFHLGYPGVLLCLQTAARNRLYRDPLLLFPPLLLLMAIVTPSIIYVRRGPMFPMAVVLMYGYTLARGKRANPILIVGGLVGVGLVMLLFVSIRDYSVAEGSWQGRRFQEMDASKVLLTKATQIDDNEYMFHCAISATCWETGANDYGTGYLTLLTHWVPRQWWPDKPTLGEGFLGEDPVPLMPAVTGIGLSGGAATGGVGETYCHLGLYALVLWFVFGWGCGRLYTRCLVTRSPQAQATYIAVAASSHWLVSQGFAAAFVPGMIYLALPWAVYSFARVAPSR